MPAESPGLLLTLAAFALTIGVLVFIHEMGHYLVGRWCGVHADRFSIGFGRELAGWTDRRGTRWTLGLLPLGGYVQFAGDADPSSRPAKAAPGVDRSRWFSTQPLWRRAAIVAAGPVTNFLFAILILAGFLLAYGESVTPAKVERFLPGSAAAAMQLRPGDRIVSVNGHKVDDFTEMATEVSIYPGAPVTLELLRDGRTAVAEGKLGTRIERDRFGNEYRFGQIGLPWPKPEVRPVGVLEAPLVATAKTADIVRLMVTTLGQVISGRRPVTELGGPLKIAQVSGEQMSAGFDAYIGFVALISINLGFINLLPIPMLDGGHLLLYAIEAVRGRPASVALQEWAFRAGFALVVSFMVLVTFNDLTSFGLFRN